MSASEIEQILNDQVKFKALAKAAFDTVDTDNSGFIDETELKQVMIQVSGEVGCPSPAQPVEVGSAFSERAQGTPVK